MPARESWQNLWNHRKSSKIEFLGSTQAGPRSSQNTQNTFFRYYTEGSRTSCSQDGVWGKIVWKKKYLFSCALFVCLKWSHAILSMIFGILNKFCIDIGVRIFFSCVFFRWIFFSKTFFGGNFENFENSKIFIFFENFTKETLL